MFRQLIERFYKSKQPARQRVLLASCFKASEETYLLYDEAEQALEYLFHWHGSTDQPNGMRMQDGGYFPITSINPLERLAFSNHIHSLLEHNSLPIIFSNSCESFIDCLADYSEGRVGVMNLNQHMDLVSSSNFVPMAGFSRLQCEKADIEMLSLGVFEERLSRSELVQATELGVGWINSSAFYSAHAEMLQRELESFLSRNQAIALNIDLQSVVRGMTIQPPFALEFQLVLAVIRTIMQSNKVLLVQLTGDTEALIFSSEAKKIVDVLRAKATSVHYAA